MCVCVQDDMFNIDRSPSPSPRHAGFGDLQTGTRVFVNGKTSLVGLIILFYFLSLFGGGQW